MEEKLRQALEEVFAPTSLKIQNDSHLHAGHQGSPETGESHFSIYISSSVFSGKSRVERHQLVMDVCKPFFQQGLHALSLKIDSA